MVLLSGGSQISSQEAQRYVKDRGYFYRFRAAFEVKATGEKIDFDYVVACNIRLTRWRDGGLSDDGTFGPRAMFKATSGGQVVMLRTQRACGGLTSDNDDVPPDLLPLAVWFEDSNNLSVGVGYVSEDAYDSPIGKLTFRGARVDRASRDDWEVWRKTSADTYKQIGEIPGPWGYDFPALRGALASDQGKFATGCRGYVRLKVPENMRSRLASLRPSNDTQFWTLPVSEERLKIGAVIDDPTQSNPPGIGGWARRFGTPGDSVSKGLPVRSGRVVEPSAQRHGVPIKHAAVRWPTESYPLLVDPLRSISPITMAAFPPADTYRVKLEYRAGELNGLAACQNLVDASGSRVRESDPQWKSKPHVFEVDNVIVKELDAVTPDLSMPQYLVERDEAVFIAYNIIF